jgi:hypothetical protein
LILNNYGSYADNQIWLQVPDISGFGPYQGQLYVTRGQLRSAPVPFQFFPALDFVQLSLGCDNPQASITPIDYGCPYKKDNWLFPPPDNPNNWVVHTGLEDLSGHKAEDRFYLTTVLKNGWVVDSVAIDSWNFKAADGGPDGGAYIVESRVGTNSPYVDVHWWTDAFGVVSYHVVVNIRGPRGLPYQ